MISENDSADFMNDTMAGSSSSSSLVVSDGYWQQQQQQQQQQQPQEEFIELPTNNRPRLSRARLLHCLKKKKILFVGNSHIRDMLLNVFHVIEPKRNYNRRDNVTRHRSQSFIGENIFLRLLFAQHSEGLESELITTEYHHNIEYDVVFAYTGIFHILFQDLTPEETIRNIRRFFSIILRDVKAKKYVLMNMYDVHPPHSKHRMPFRTRNRQCFHHDRAYAYRVMIRCVIDALIFVNQQHKKKDKRKNIQLMDIGAITRNARNMSIDGNHYDIGSPPLNAMTRVIQDAICQPRSDAVVNATVTGDSVEEEERHDLSEIFCTVPTYDCNLNCRCPSALTKPTKVHQETCSKYANHHPDLTSVYCYPENTTWKTILEQKKVNRNKTILVRVV